jgi:RimJ/RimL family protein N-acetyltransferase
MADPIELVPYEARDLELTVALETDPVVMKELGGPTPRADLDVVHDRRMRSAEFGDLWLTIVLPGAAEEPRRIGQIGVFNSARGGEPVHEAGWSLLPQFHGRGIGSRALAMLIARLRNDGGSELIHAYPSVGNAASNALCEKLGFELAGQASFPYRGTELRCNHWQLRLRAAD